MHFRCVCPCSFRSWAWWRWRPAALASPFVQIVETVGTANRESGKRRCAKRACACVRNVTGRRDSYSPYTLQSWGTLPGDPLGQLKPHIDLVPPSCLVSWAIGSYSSGSPAARTLKIKVNRRFLLTGWVTFYHSKFWPKIMLKILHSQDKWLITLLSH